MSNRPGPLAQSIAAEVRAELGRQNKSRRWLAEQIGQSHVTVSRWVNGDGGMTFDALDSVCHALGISVADLLRTAEQFAPSLPAPTPSGRRRASAGATPVRVAAGNTATSRRARTGDTDRYLSSPVTALARRSRTVAIQSPLVAQVA